MAVDIYFPACGQSITGFARVFLVRSADIACAVPPALDPDRFEVGNALAAWTKHARPYANAPTGAIRWEPLDAEGKQLSVAESLRWKGGSANLATLLAIANRRVGVQSSAIGGATILWATGAIGSDGQINVDAGSLNIQSKLALFLRVANSTSRSLALLVPDYLGQYIHTAHAECPPDTFELRVMSHSIRVPARRPLVIVAPTHNLSLLLDELTEGAFHRRMESRHVESKDAGPLSLRAAARTPPSTVGRPASMALAEPPQLPKSASPLRLRGRCFALTATRPDSKPETVLLFPRRRIALCDLVGHGLDANTDGAHILAHRDDTWRVTITLARGMRVQFKDWACDQTFDELVESGRDFVEFALEDQDSGVIDAGGSTIAFEFIDASALDVRALVRASQQEALAMARCRDLSGAIDVCEGLREVLGDGGNKGVCALLASLYLERSKQAIRQGDDDCALQDVGRAIDLAPGEVSYRQARTDLLVSFGLHAQAVHDLRFQSANTPEECELHGTCYVKAGWIRAGLLSMVRAARMYVSQGRFVSHDRRDRMKMAARACVWTWLWAIIEREERRGRHEWADVLRPVLGCEESESADGPLVISERLEAALILAVRKIP